MSPLLAKINERLAAMGSDEMVLKAELLLEGTTTDGVTKSLIIANDRFKGFGAEFVPGDPRRGATSEVELRYAYALEGPFDTKPFTRLPNGSGVRQLVLGEMEALLDEGTNAWLGQKCTDKVVREVTIPATNTNPDFFDDLVFLLEDPDDPQGRSLAGYTQPADIVQGGWLSRPFWLALDSTVGPSVLGITFTSVFAVGGQPTDIDGNGLADTRRAEIYYNDGWWWGTSGALNVIDFYSVITHETGHAFGLAHFGKIFVTKSDRAGGITLSEIRYAPASMMNASYITGRNEITSTDIGAYCNVFGKTGSR